jgi:hypothetical protein
MLLFDRDWIENSADEPQSAAATGAFIKLEPITFCDWDEGFENSGLTADQTSGFSVHGNRPQNGITGNNPQTS